MKPTIQIYIDKVRVMNPIITEAKEIRVPKYNDMTKTDLSRYTYLKDMLNIKFKLILNLIRTDQI